MPLCTLEIPRGQLIGEQIEAAKSFCESVKAATINGLGIPNKDDWEIRIDATEAEPKITVAYTVGSHEYPDFKPESFFPTNEQAHATAQAILGITSPFNFSETAMQAWKDTTFVYRGGQMPEPDQSNLSFDRAEVGKSITQPKVTLVIAPEVLGHTSSKDKETEPNAETEPFHKIAKEVWTLISETLGVPEQVGEIQVQIALLADAKFSVEFDCLSDPPIPQEAREEAAKKVMDYLNTDRLTQDERDGSAEVWIRQGSPTTITVHSSKITGLT